MKRMTAMIALLVMVLVPVLWTAEERAALADGDLEALFRLGANPYLIRRVFRHKFAV